MRKKQLILKNLYNNYLIHNLHLKNNINCNHQEINNDNVMSFRYKRKYICNIPFDSGNTCQIYMNRENVKRKTQCICI